MALQVWRPWDYYDILFPGVNTFAHYLNILDDWASSLIHTVSRYVWDAILHESRHQIGHASRELVARGSGHFQDLMARLIENSRWVLTTGPSNVYSHLESYYRQLPGISPPQARDLYRRLQEKIPDRHQLAVATDESAEVIETYPAPGGAHQRVCPDWMLPLVLGLYGDITPTFGEYLRKEDGPQKKRRRL
ncbi:VP3 structural protein [Bornean orang-utan polyomavirus]|nr:VP3 structural protein [Bornean orang-utan polyomavirus]CAX87746.1 VP3 structural protein [Bornean orang-utan polyomavirus]